MKNRGLQNRFPSVVQSFWFNSSWYDCMICGMNQWNCLHHILSPSNSFYISGTHNKSILNSSPLHNMLHPSEFQLKRQGMSGFGVDKSCHFGNDTFLHKPENTKMLLRKTFFALRNLGYELTSVDLLFIKVYKDLYDDDVINLI